jgi:hypothetical protein
VPKAQVPCTPYQPPNITGVKGLLSGVDRTARSPDACRSRPAARSGSRPPPEKCQLRTENCQLRTEKCQLRTEKCQLRTEKCQLRTEKCQLRTEKCQLRTEKCQLSTWRRTASSAALDSLQPTPAINEGCTRSLRISHSMYCIVPTTCVFDAGSLHSLSPAEHRRCEPNNQPCDLDHRPLVLQ